MRFDYSTQALSIGESLLNIWFIMGAFVLSLLCLIRESLMNNFNAETLQQREAEDMLRKQIDLLCNVADKK